MIQLAKRSNSFRPSTFLFLSHSPFLLCLSSSSIMFDGAHLSLLSISTSHIKGDPFSSFLSSLSLPTMVLSKVIVFSSLAIISSAFPMPGGKHLGLSWDPSQSFHPVFHPLTNRNSLQITVVQIAINDRDTVDLPRRITDLLRTTTVLLPIRMIVLRIYMVLLPPTITDFLVIRMDPLRTIMALLLQTMALPRTPTDLQ